MTAGPPRLERFQITIERFQSRGQHLCQFIGTKESVDMVKRVQLPEDFLGTPTWPPFHCFRTPIWPPWRHVKTLYTMDQLRFQVNKYTIDGIIDGIFNFSPLPNYVKILLLCNFVPSPFQLHSMFSRSNTAKVWPYGNLAGNLNFFN